MKEFHNTKVRNSKKRENQTQKALLIKNLLANHAPLTLCSEL